LLVPPQRVDVEEHRPRRVADVGDVLRAVGQLPNQPAVDRAEREFALLRTLSRAGDVVEQPSDFARRKVCVDEQSGLGLDGVGRAARLQRFAIVRSPTILPDDRVVDRLAGRAVPDDGRFALVGDPDGRDVAGRQLRARQRFDRDADLRGPDLLRVVLDPSGLRKDLREFFLRDRTNGAVVIEHDGPRAGRSLVEREHVTHPRDYTMAPMKRELLAEFLGTFVLIVFGVGVVAQVVLSKQTAGSYLSINIAWGLAVTMGCYVCAGVTGAHLNPAVTIALAVHRKLPWNKVLPYSIAQLAGAFVASAVVFVTYHEALNAFDSGVRHVTGPLATAGIWATYPQPFLSTFPGGFIDQVVGTALLVGVILGITDSRNSPAPAGLAPVVVGLLVVLIGATFGFNSGYAINPARDFGPRLFTFVAGWGGEVFSAGNSWWWVP